MVKLKNFKTLAILIVCFLLTSFVCYAAIGNPLKYDSFEKLIGGLIDGITLIGVAIAPIFIIYAGFLYMTSGGDSTKLTTAKKIILYVVIGLFILFLSKGLIAIIKDVIGLNNGS